MIRNRVFLALILMLSATACSLSAEQGVWRLTQTEIWWVQPHAESSALKRIPDVPWGTQYRSADGTTVTIVTGHECDVVRTEIRGHDRGTLTCTWNHMPAVVKPDDPFTITCESKGNLGNGIGIGGPNRYEDNVSGWVQSFRDGVKSAQRTMPRPGPSGPTRMKIVVDFGSGGAHHIQYVYVYEWQRGSADSPSSTRREAVVGSWQWFNGCTVTFKADGTCSDGTMAGTWSLSGTVLTINWAKGRYVDSLTLVNDRRIEGGNQHGTQVWGNKR